MNLIAYLLEYSAHYPRRLDRPGVNLHNRIMAYVYQYPRGKKAGSAWIKLEPYFTLARGSFFPHSHAFMELTFVISGKGLHRYSGKTHKTRAGDLIFCPPGLVHQFLDSEGQTHRNIHFDPSLLSGLKKEAADLAGLDELFPASGPPSRTLRLDPKELTWMEQSLREMDAEQRMKRPGGSASMALQLKRILIALARLAGQRDSLPVAAGAPVSTGLAGAYRSIRERPAEIHSLASLADASGHSVSHFRRLFRQAYGEAPIHLLVRERVRMACGLLENGDGTITDIALRCGFADSNYFSRQFMRVMNTSPREFRKHKAGGLV
jgi:AraC-like DNA-binding protein